MDKILRNFGEQLSWKPEVENKKRLTGGERVFVCGMGGSRLGGDLAQAMLPIRDISVHADFGAPPHANGRSLVIASSYSGETEEALDAFARAGERKIPRAVITGGGRLLEAAQKAGVPFIEIPEKNIPPRLAVGYNIKALLALIGETLACEAIEAVAVSEDLEARGAAFAAFIGSTVPIVYAARRMSGLAYYWKVVLNETAKIQAFANSFPEAVHNEIEGFEGAGKNFSCIMLRGPSDDPRIARRMDMMTQVLGGHRIPVERVFFTGGEMCQEIFSSVLLANWTAYALAKSRGMDPLATPLIDEWKRELNT